MFKFANFLSKPYLYIGNRKPNDVNHLIDKLRLYTAIQVFRIFYFFSKKNGALFLEGKCYQSLGNYEKALNLFKKTWETTEFNPTLFKEIGTMCLKLHKYEEGLRFAQKEVSENPNDCGALTNFAIFSLMIGRINEAFQIVSQAARLEEKSTKPLFEYIKSIKDGTKPIPKIWTSNLV